MTVSGERSLSQEVQINDADFLNRDDLHQLLGRLRDEAPVFWCADPGVWLISRYQDVRDISQRPAQFTSSKGITLNDAKYKGDIEGNLSAEFVPEGAEPLMTTDPPRHNELRTMVSRRFTPKAVSGMEETIRATAQALLDTVPVGQPLDIVEHVGAHLSIATVMRILGVPADMAPDFRYWSDQMFRMGADLSREELRETAANVAPMYECIAGQMAHKAEHPSDDILSLLVKAQAEGAISPLNAAMLASTFLVAGHETTRSSIGAVCMALHEHRDQYDLLRSDPSLAGGAVDEILRMYPVVPGFMRTATDDTDIRGQAIAADDAVYLLYVSANRDAEVFLDPHTFDITRENKPGHLAFGIGEHYCPGAGLARLQLRVLVEEMMQRYGGFELAGTPVRHRSSLENAWRHVPLVFQAA